MLALIDYGSGNVRSVFNALRQHGANVSLTADPAEIARAERIVLPGVGAFADCVNGLKQRGLWEIMQAALRDGRPFLGICVGYQMLFESSEESPGVSGFGFFAGNVRRFSTPGIKVPQIGWNTLDLGQHPLWQGLPANPHVYFVHSYFPEPRDPSVVIARSNYGETFAAAAARGPVAGVQFHPEKSQAVGLGILRNFLAWQPERDLQALRGPLAWRQHAERRHEHSLRPVAKRAGDSSAIPPGPESKVSFPSAEY